MTTSTVRRLALDIPEAAAVCSVTAQVIRAAIHSGALKAKRQSRNKDGDGVGKYLITTSALEAWLDGLPDG